MPPPQGTPISKGTHDYADDPRNETIRINVNGELFARHEARVSVFDSGFVPGDGVWEGLPFLGQHFDRL